MAFNGMISCIITMGFKSVSGRFGIEGHGIGNDLPQLECVTQVDFPKRFNMFG